MAYCRYDSHTTGILRTGGSLAIGAFAGCTGTVWPPRVDDGDDTLPDDHTGDPTGGTRPRGTGGPGLSLATVDAAPSLPVRPEVAVTRDTATADHPPQPRVTVTNEGGDALGVGECREIIFAHVADTGGQLLLLPAGSGYPAEADCWRLAEPVAVTEEYRVVDLAPGESTSTAHPDRRCLPVGTFRFESDYAVTADTDGVPDAGDGETWGFSVSLE